MLISKGPALFTRVDFKKFIGDYLDDSGQSETENEECKINLEFFDEDCVEESHTEESPEIIEVAEKSNPEMEKLFALIGKLKIENDFLKSKK